ncbi:MAG: hypothetical protein AUJ72_00960 [Candidatus Omnitrophica bacterium CG1_02_46_14]|nr:MAG: hypothetical protein AUJ72_00960 [Candidatus Omnitrophica bacterium CG1_02_46_14]
MDYMLKLQPSQSTKAMFLEIFLLRVQKALKEWILTQDCRERLLKVQRIISQCINRKKFDTLTNKRVNQILFNTEIILGKPLPTAIF